MADKVSRIEGAAYYTGLQTFESVVLPKSAIGNAEVDASDPLDGTKVVRRLNCHYKQGNVAATTETFIIHSAYANGRLLEFRVGNIARAAGAATVTVDLKNSAGVTQLTGVVTLNSTTPSAAGINFVTGTLIATPTFTADEIFEVIVTATAGGGTLPTGLFIDLILDENPS